MTIAAGSLERFEDLLGPQGRDLLERLDRMAVTPATALRAGSALRAEYPAGLVADALAQHELRIRARSKFERAGSMFFTRPGLEQASSEVVAQYRARRYAHLHQVADLCCGIGGDLIALAAHHQVLAVDTDPLHLRIAQANAGVYGVAGNVRAACADVREVSLARADAAFIDPARRSAGRRMRPGDSEPSLPWCVALADRVRHVGIKAAPGLAHGEVPAGWELEFIAIRRDLKEAVAWSPAMATVARRATILPEGHTLVPAPGLPVPVRAPGEFLCDPSPAVTRAGLVEELARDLGAWKIDERIAFLSSDTPLRTPFGRGLRVIDSSPWNQKRLPTKLRDLDIGVVDIRRRGLAGDVGQLLRRLKLTGSRRATVVMTRVEDRPWGLICVSE
jgi:SAM-dependent methyltransferase